MYRDQKIRIMKVRDGEKQRLLINRLRCRHCQRLHNELPDCLLPYKHYTAELIEGVLDDTFDVDSDTYPTDMTILRWLKWFATNKLRIEGYLKAIQQSLFGLSEAALSSTESLLLKIQNGGNGWLSTVVRIIYNSGGFLVPIR